MHKFILFFRQNSIASDRSELSKILQTWKNARPELWVQAEVIVFAHVICKFLTFLNYLLSGSEKIYSYLVTPR